MQVGTGRFHYIALVICGMANAADAVEILGMSLVLPAAGEDLGLDAGAKGALGSCIFLGMLLGASWGLLADRIGARNITWYISDAAASEGAPDAVSHAVGLLVTHA
jgi:VNT family MFS transporter (synaptic vesicle glycoprotein 2)